MFFEISTISAEEFFELQSLILMDLEFTCWEDSLRTGWSRQDRPPEILEIGLVAYDLKDDKVIDTYQSYVKPALNPGLSSYCRNLLKLSQAAIDCSLPLVNHSRLICDWLLRLEIPSAPTCSWGEDRSFLDDRPVQFSQSIRGKITSQSGRVHLQHIGSTVSRP
ncbi:exonuclease domain-containing protein [Thermodesulfobacteriota bacterium]